MKVKTKKSATDAAIVRDKFVDRKGKIFNIIVCFGYGENCVYGVAVSDVKTGRRISVIPDSLSNTVAEVNQKFVNYAKNNRWLAVTAAHYAKIKAFQNQYKRNKPQKHNKTFR